MSSNPNPCRHGLIALLLILCSLPSFAQLHLGDAVITISGANWDDQVVKIYAVGNTNNAPRGDNWGLGDSVFANWGTQTLGQVFGIAINTVHPEHLIYVSTTQIYEQTGYTYPSGYRCFPLPNPAGVPLIWELNAQTGTARALVVSTLQDSLSNNTTNAIFNRGTAIGNICFDKRHNQLFATNMEDGRIYRIDAFTGKVLSRYDPFTAFTYALPDTTPRFVDLGERLWGIGYSNFKLYFSAWNEDYSNISHGPNKIYSVGIDTVTGEFLATAAGNYNFTASNPALQITMPNINANYSNPVADIEFSENGQIMMLAERTMDGPAMQSDIPFPNWAHKGRVLQYVLSGSTWAPSLRNYYLGNNTDATCTNCNCTGGVDFGYSSVGLGAAQKDTCESMIWATGDALKGPWAPGGTQTGEYVWGFAGLPASGNTEYLNPNNYTPLPTSANVSSIYQDAFENNVMMAHGKSNTGDIDIYRQPCNCVATSAQVCFDTLVFATVHAAYCPGDTLSFFIQKPGGGSVSYFVDNNWSVHRSSDVIALSTNGDWLQVNLNNIDSTFIGTNRFCVLNYSSDPNQNDDWCSVYTCRDFIVQNCACDTAAPMAYISQVSDTVCIGDSLTVSFAGGNWGHFFHDGQSTNLMFFGGDTLTFTTYIDTPDIGHHSLCLTSYTGNPDSTNVWCSNTACRYVVVRDCNAVSTGLSSMESRETQVRCYPNPAADNITIEIKTPGTNNASIEILDYLGRTVRRNSFKELTAGTNLLPFNMSGMAAGFYELKVIVDNQVKVLKLVKD